MSAPSRGKGQIALIVAVLVGLVIGRLIKKASIGFAIGAIAGLMVLMILSKRKN